MLRASADGFGRDGPERGREDAELRDLDEQVEIELVEDLARVAGLRSRTVARRLVYGATGRRRRDRGCGTCHGCV